MAGEQWNPASGSCNLFFTYCPPDLLVEHQVSLEVAVTRLQSMLDAEALEATKQGEWEFPEDLVSMAVFREVYRIEEQHLEGNEYDYVIRAVHTPEEVTLAEMLGMPLNNKPLDMAEVVRAVGRLQKRAAATKAVLAEARTSVEQIKTAVRRMK